MEKKEATLQVGAKDEILQGIYSNSVMVQHSKHEFLLDFLTLFQPRGVLASRIILNPAHAKNLLGILNQQVALYEKTFGLIEEEAWVEPKGSLN